MHHLPSPRKKEIVSRFLKQGILLSSELLDSISETDNFESVSARMHTPEGALVMSQDVQHHHGKDINWAEIERVKVMQEKGNTTSYTRAMDNLSTIAPQAPPLPPSPYTVKVISSYAEENTKRDVQDFVDYFNHRFAAIEKILKGRQGMQATISIRHILKKTEKESLALVGMVSSKDTTKNGNLMLTVEDQTGSIKVLVNRNKPELYRKAEEIVLDEVIGIVGVSGDKIVFANEVYQPDVPAAEAKKAPDEAYAAFISDLHVGSTKFLPDDFEKFLKWINGEAGNDKQREIASNIKYLFVTGDLVDGVGIYPGQEDELEVKDIYEQYRMCAELLKRVPSRIQMIICAGNHDAVRLAEPQPLFPRTYCAPIYEIPHATIVSNPALINIHSSEDFPGFNVLLYHGYSFDHYVAEVSTLRNQGGYDRADLIMRFLLQRRHLAPTHTSTQYIPDTKRDPLVIDTVPDFFISGHIHKSVSANYKGTTLICGSCWQSKTAFQEKVGHHPEPSRVPVVNLKTRDIKILKFGNQ